MYVSERSMGRVQAIVAGRSAVRDGTLRQVRERAGLSQAEIAGVLDVTPPTVSRWESGDRVPRGETAERLNYLLVELDKVAKPGGGC